MRLQAKGYLTVFLSLSITIILSLILALYQGARIGAMKMRTECVSDIAMNSVLAEYQQVVSAGHITEGRIVAYRLMRETLRHRAVTDAERLFPDVVTRDVFESVLLVESDDVAREVLEKVAEVA